MRRFRASSYEYDVLLKAPGAEPAFPYIRDDNGPHYMFLPSPLHGRSFVVSQTSTGYIVSKGNGLAYTEHAFINTEELATDSWGLLLKDYAIRDFTLGEEIKELGIETNEMQYVLELSPVCHISGDNSILHPCLLQYKIKCPFRIEDAPFISMKTIKEEVKGWSRLNNKGVKQSHEIAANVIARNLRIMHDHKILHNAISINNYSWALELLDFELSCSPQHPYDSEYSRMQAESLYGREIIYAYQIVLYIAGVLKEFVDYSLIDRIFLDNGFDIKSFVVTHD